MDDEILDLAKFRRQEEKRRNDLPGDSDIPVEYYQGIGPEPFAGFFSTETGERLVLDGDEEATVLDFPVKDKE